MLTFLSQLKRKADTCYESLLPSAEPPYDTSHKEYALLAQTHVYVPPHTVLSNEIIDILGNDQLQRKYLYNRHVLEKLDSQEQQLVLDINGERVSEVNFIKWFRPTGDIDPRALCIQSKLWNHEWKAKHKPYFVVPKANPLVST
jgi:hypothetical protein